MLFGPDTHAENAPETWQVVRAGARSWHVVASDGATLSYHTTRRDALAEMAEGSFTRRLYDDETRWFAGESVRGWRPWAVVEPEYRRSVTSGALTGRSAP